MWRFAGFAICGLMLGGVAQAPAKPEYAATQSMLQDRADDSYAIYSMLLTSGPIEWRDTPRKQWLVEDTTRAERADVGCHPQGPGTGMDPHNAVTPPDERKAEWLELLADYDLHCHDRIKLQADAFHVSLPVHLMSETDSARFRSERGRDWYDGPGKAPEFLNAAGLHHFSEVYFNAHHTMALVEQGMWCGGLCADQTWVVLERKDGAWHRLRWRSTYVIS